MKQTIQVTVEFKVEHTPGNEVHLKQILDNHLRPKGVEYDINSNKIYV